MLHQWELPPFLSKCLTCHCVSNSVFSTIQEKVRPPRYFSRSGLSLSLIHLCSLSSPPRRCPRRCVTWLWLPNLNLAPQTPGRAFLIISDHQRKDQLEIPILVCIGNSALYMTFVSSWVGSYFTNWPRNGSFPRKLPNHWVRSNYVSAPRLVTLRTSE